MSSAATYQPWVGGPFRWRLNLRPLDIADWFEFDEHSDAMLAEKGRLLDQHRATVERSMPHATAACEEVLAAVREHLVAHHPERLTAPVAGDHPLVGAARLVPEDLAVLIEHDGRLVFGAGVVCFPNRWDLASKIGHPLRAVHTPVAQLNEQLAAPIDAFFDRLSPAKSYWRLGWGLIETDELYQPLDGTAPPRGPIPLGGGRRRTDLGSGRA